MAALVLAEHDNRRLRPSTLNVIAAAAKMAGEVHVLVAGGDCGEVARQVAQVAGLTKVLLADAPHLADELAECVSEQVVALASGYSHVLAAATSFGKDVLPRAAARRDCALVSDIVAVESPDTFARPIYAGNAIATVRCEEPIKFVTVRPTAFDAAAAQGGSAPIETVAIVPDPGLSRFVSLEGAKADRPELQGARVVVSGGRGLGSAENFRLLEKLADRLNAALGASRAAVDAGYAPNDWQVGQTGKIVAPQLYLAIGISGAIQHLAGMKDSKVIVAINKDPEAPIFQLADYGLVADLFEALPQLLQELG
ncbi:MAG: electron transfer flavoprotein subunit alpha/FixB family protein [Betaproteobacteria bacterium]|nr:MAG: electron transfer flavoprotein subunit alpha/FixB family protein [Betaproteobacteria bacterium]